jgi:hypothetical protein
LPWLAVAIFTVPCKTPRAASAWDAATTAAEEIVGTWFKGQEGRGEWLGKEARQVKINIINNS